MSGCGLSGEEGGGAEDLSEAVGGERVLGGDVECRTGETVWGGELGMEEEGEKELRFACAAGENTQRLGKLEGGGC